MKTLKAVFQGMSRGGFVIGLLCLACSVYDVVGRSYVLAVVMGTFACINFWQSLPGLRQLARRVRP